MGSITEMLIRNSCTPVLSHSDVSSAEIETKIRLVTTYVRRVFLEGTTPTGDAVDAIVLLILSNILSRSDLAKKYGTMMMERLGSYSYELASTTMGGANVQSSPTVIIKSWHNLAIEILNDLAAEKKYVIRKANE